MNEIVEQRTILHHPKQKTSRSSGLSVLRPSIKSLELEVSPEDLHRRPAPRVCQLTKNELIEHCMKKNFKEKRRYLKLSPSQKRY